MTYKYYTHKEVEDILGISRKQLTILSKDNLSNKKTRFLKKDIEVLKNILYNNEMKEVIKMEVKDEKNIDIAGENECYAKIIKGNETWGVSVFSSTGLSEDIRRMKSKGMQLVIINYEEANKLYKDIYRGISRRA